MIPIIEFDCETTGLQPFSGKNEAFLWIFYDGDESAVIPYSPSGAAIPAWSVDAGDYEHTRAEIQAWFDRGKEEGIRAHNAKFDRAFADAAGFDVPGDACWHDSMVVAHAVDERRSIALKAVASELFGEEAADPQKKLKDWLNTENRRRQKEARENGEEEYERANYSHVPREIMEPYALEDVILTRRISDAYQPILDASEDLSKVVEFERQAMGALYAIEKRGMPVAEDGVEYRKLEQEVIENIEKLEQRVMDLAAEGDPVIYAKTLAGDSWGKDNTFVETSEDGTVTNYIGGAQSLADFNPKSTAQVIAALKARGADLSYMSLKDGKLSADAENLRAVDDELATAILEFRAEFKVLSTYVRPMVNRSYVSAMNTYKEPFIAPDNRIHATYRQVGARTARMSCADPNMQNQPRDDLRLRYNIRADEGHKLITCDFSNIEMVLFAAYCGEGRLLSAVQNGEDLHELTARMIGLRDRKRPGGGIESARQLGKVFNFTIIYGGGLRSIKRYFRCSQEDARLFKNRYMDAYPEVKRLQNRILFRLEDDGYIQDKLISGRRFRVAPRDSYKGVNYLVQGTAAALLKYAVIQLHAESVPMVGLVHDEIIAHVPEDEAAEVAALIEEKMTSFPGLKGVVPLRADADIVDRWSDAKPLTDPDGRKYYFDPEWANVPRRYLEQAVPL